MGSGEVTRYLSTYGSSRVRKAALLGTIPPFLLKTDDNPGRCRRSGLRGDPGGDRQGSVRVLRGLPQRVLQRRCPRRHRISDRAWEASFNVAVGSSPVRDPRLHRHLVDRLFRADLAKIDIPVLVVHGTADRLLPFEATAARLPALLADCTLVRVEGGSHNIGWTHPEEVNSALLEFIGANVPLLAPSLNLRKGEP